MPNATRLANGGFRGHRHPTGNDLDGGAKLPLFFLRHSELQAQKAEIISVPRTTLTDDQSQGTKVASTVARGAEIRGISRLFH